MKAIAFTRQTAVPLTTMFVAAGVYAIGRLVWGVIFDLV